MITLLATISITAIAIVPAAQRREAPGAG